LFLKISPETRDGMDITEETAERLAKLGESFSTDALMRYLDILGELAQEIRLSTIKRITLEMALIRMVRPQMQTDNAALLGRVEQLESRMDRVGDEVKRQLEKIPAGAFSGSAAGGVSGGMAGGSSEGQGPSDDTSDARLYGGAKVPTRDELLRMTDEEKAVLRRSYTVPSQELLDKIAADWGREAADLPQPYSEFARKLKVRSAKGWLVIDNDWTEYADSRINVNFFVRNLKQITDAISDKYGRTIVFNVRHKPVDESYFRSSKASFKTKAKIDFPVENN
ncbi:MAG: hypothetical protein IJV21_02170, partial [Lachnospiraceae bacterium]|nr:hypothetical protein [Lachnospiraceae bacterium]